MNPFFFWGATGQSIVLEEILKEEGYRLAGIADNNPQTVSPFPGIPIFHGKEAFEQWYAGQGHDLYYAVAIGGDKGAVRISIGEYLEKKGLTPVNLIHSTSYISTTARLGKAVQVLAQSAVCARVQLGDHVIINTSASVDHEGVIGNGVHIGPGAKLAGCVEIGNNSFIGTGAIVLPRIKIGANTIVGAGAIVTRDVPDNVVCYGTPAKIISERTP